MNKSNWAFRSLGMIILSLLVGCISCTNYTAESSSDCVDTIPPPSTVNGREAPYFHIRADQYLQEGHKLAILAAINEWAEETHFTVRYTLEFIDMSNVSYDPKEKHTISIYVKDPGPGYVGWTEWTTSNQSAHILIEPSIPDNEFRKIMLHELGHAFDLHFDNGGDNKQDIHYTGPCESVMHPSIGEASEHLSCPELQSFCSNYGCQVDCTNLLRK